MSDRRAKLKAIKEEKLMKALDMPIHKLKTQNEVINHLNGIWDRMKTGLTPGQEKDPEKIKKLKSDIALRLLMPGLGAERMGSRLDEFPQVLTVSGVQPAVNGFLEIQVPLAINRLSVTRGKAWVVEILKIFPSSVVSGYLNPLPSADGFQEEFWQASTSRIGAIDFTDPTVFANDRRGKIISVETLVGFVYQFIPEWPAYSLETNGRGYLVGVDNIFLAYDTLSFTAVNGPVWKIHYRFAEVGLAEYVGMVEGQQEA